MMAKRGTEYRWTFEAHSEPSSIWQLFESLNENLVARGIPTPKIPGKRRQHGPAASLFTGAVDTATSTLEWVQGHSMHSVQKYKSGMLSECECIISVEPGSDGGTTIQYYLRLVSASPIAGLLIPFMVGMGEHRRLQRYFKEIDKSIASGVNQCTNSTSHISKNKEPFVAKVQKELVENGFDANWVGKLIRLIASEADKLVATMRPPRLAEQWGAPRQQIFDLFLHGANQDLLDMEWIVSCPKCGGGEVVYSQLDKLEKKIKCPSCEEPVVVNASENLELTFRPHPSVRKLNAKITRKHGRNGEGKVVIQRQIAPESIEESPIELTPGLYRIRTEGSPPLEWAEFSVGENSQGEVFAQAEEKGIKLIQRQDAPDQLVKFSNQKTTAQRFFLEDITWKTQRILGLEALASQTFRQLYPQEAPPSAVTIELEALTLLVSKMDHITDGDDAIAFRRLRELVRVQRDLITNNQGCVVSLSNDVLVAAFRDSTNAIQAGLGIQHDFETFAASLPPECGKLALSIGIHTGPCLAVNLNGYCDFFGTTVYTAMKIRDACLPGEVRISDRISTTSRVQDMLRIKHLSVDKPDGINIVEDCEMFVINRTEKAAVSAESSTDERN